MYIILRLHSFILATNKLADINIAHVEGCYHDNNTIKGESIIIDYNVPVFDNHQMTVSGTSGGVQWHWHPLSEHH